ncbi:MAG: type II toxin-antitoxin system Phd/YefM family antitoxin [Chloroflexota bacterium]
MLLTKSTWKLQDAKASLSQLIRDALDHGPQIITRRGKKTVVVISMEEYEKLLPQEKKPTLAEFLLNAPKVADDDFEFERIKDYPRDLDL